MFRVPLRPQAVTRARRGRRDGARNGRGCRRAGPGDCPCPREGRHRRDRSALRANGDRRARRNCATHRARRATSFRERRRDGRRALQDERRRHDRGGWSGQGGKRPRGRSETLPHGRSGQSGANRRSPHHADARSPAPPCPRSANRRSAWRPWARDSLPCASPRERSAARPRRPPRHARASCRRASGARAWTRRRRQRAHPLR